MNGWLHFRCRVCSSANGIQSKFNIFPTPGFVYELRNEQNSIESPAGSVQPAPALVSGESRECQSIHWLNFFPINFFHIFNGWNSLWLTSFVAGIENGENENAFDVFFGNIRMDFFIDKSFCIFCSIRDDVLVGVRSWNANITRHLLRNLVNFVQLI